MMNIRQLFDFSVKFAIAADPRGPKGVQKYLERLKKAYEKMAPEDKNYFELELLTNPYGDSFIHVDDGKTTVKRVLAGIDINPAEILLASQLNERGKKIDLAVSHHPEGKGLAYLPEVMRMNTDIYEASGVPIHLAEKITEERLLEVDKGVHHMNFNQAIDVARLLGINFMSTHTVTDNLVNKFVKEYLEKAKPETVGDIVDALLELPEYQEARKYGAGPKIVGGSRNHRVGKYIVEMTGGTTPSSKVYQELSRFGISTVVGMHMQKDSMKQANELQLNVIMAGHMSSDSLGMNLLLDEYEKQGIDVIPCGGLIRVSRVKGGGKRRV